ncbi:hypothetical protein AAHC03_022720 [Spirometra sp. Aus1]
MPGAECLSLAIFQLDYLISAISKKSFKANAAEINQLLFHNGNALERHFLRALFSTIDFSPYEVKNTSKEFNQIQLLAHELQSAQSRPNFTSLVCFAVQHSLNAPKWQLKPSRQLLSQVSRMLKLNRVQELVFSLALTHALNGNLAKQALIWFRHKLRTFIQLQVKSNSEEKKSLESGSGSGSRKGSVASVDSKATAASKSSGEEQGSSVDFSNDGDLTALHEVGIEILHFLLCHLLALDNPYGLTEDSLVSFYEILRADFPRDRVPLVLSSLLYPTVPEDLALTKTFPEPGQLALTASSISGPETTPEIFEEENDITSDIVSQSPSHTGVHGDSAGHNDGASRTVTGTGCLVAEVLEELGYACTASLDVMRMTLSDFSAEELTPAVVARCVCLFMRTCKPSSLSASVESRTASSTPHPVSASSSLGLCVRDLISFVPSSSSSATGNGSAAWKDVPPGLRSPTLAHRRFAFADGGFGGTVEEEEASDWNIDNFLAAVDEINPNLNLHEIVVELDCPDFFVSNQAAFSILKRFLLRDNKSQANLPINIFYRPWKNATGQLSFLQHCCAHPDVICLAYWPFTCVDLTKYRLSQEADSASVQIWKNVDYVQALLALSNRGLFSDVQEMFVRAFRLSPEIFTATLLETPSMNALKCSMLSLAFSYFLVPRANSQIVLQTAWTGCQTNLVATARHHQRSILLATCLQAAHALSQGCWELPAAVAPYDSLGGNQPAMSYAGLIEVLLSVQGIQQQQQQITPLSVLLGTSEVASVSVSQLSLVGQGGSTGGRGGAGGTSGSESSSGEAEGFSSLSSLLTLLNPPFALILDMSLSFIMYMVDAVTALITRFGVNDPTALAPVASLQTALDSFLISWFCEQMSDKERAEAFVNELVDYFRSRYPDLVDGSTAACPRGPTLVSTVESNVFLPPDLRRPSPAVMKHIINSAHRALRSPTSCVSPTVASAAHQAFVFFLQNLTRFFSFQSSSSSTNLATAAASTAAVSGGSPSWATGQVPTLASLSASAQFDVSAAAFRSSSRKPQPGLPVSTMAAGPVGLGSGGRSGPHTAGPLSPPIFLVFNNDPIELELPKELETEVNSFFQKLLQGHNSPEEMVKIVCDYATRGTAVQKRLLDGILRMLADEVSRHLHEYPDRMLPLITELYGSVLAGLVNQLSVPALSMLWKAFLARLYLLPADTSVDAPLFRAVVHILVKAKSTITQYVNLATCLVNCHVFKLFPADLQEHILTAEALYKGYQRSSHPHITASQSAKDLLSMGSHGVQEYQPPDPPDEAISDRVCFLFNNLTKVNVKEKSADVGEILEESLLPWFAYYLVCKRVTVEHTFHDLFAMVLDFLQERLPNVRPSVLAEVFRNIKLILRSMRADKDDSTARVSLKNLGSFLGLVTLARNKPILHDDLNIKDLLYEAYSKGAVPLNYVVPFVSRVMRAATESIVFRPPNPWTVAILKVLREMHLMGDVKSTVRFEIEILFKSFDYRLEDVQPAHFLRDRSRLTRPAMAVLHAAVMAAGQQHPGLRSSDAPSGGGGFSTSGTDLAALVQSSLSATSASNRQSALVAAAAGGGGSSTSIGGSGSSAATVSSSSAVAAATAQQQQLAAAQQQEGSVGSLRYEEVDVNTLRSCLNLDEILQQLALNSACIPNASSALNLLHSEPNIRNLIQPAIEKAIDELSTPLFERCSRITVITVVTIVRKDFALDPDPTRLLYAARQMVRHLTAGMSLITAREVLGMALVNNLKSIILASIQSASAQEKEAVECITHLVVSKSMQACLAFIQKTVAERAVREVEKKLEADVKLREELGPQRFLKQAVASQQHLQQNLPECVRLNEARLLGPSRMTVYHEFGRSIPGFYPSGSGPHLATLAYNYDSRSKRRKALAGDIHLQTQTPAGQSSRHREPYVNE